MTGKNILKLKVKQWRGSKNPILKCMAIMLGKVWKLLRFVKQFICNKNMRSVFLMKLFHGKRVQQTTQLTWEDRYPDVFQECKKFFEMDSKRELRILSYGCCTGEEVITLRHYFPNATIVGAEINSESLKVCKKRKTDDKIHFIKSSVKNISKYGPFDIVFCMAVLQRTPHYVEDNHITDIKNLYPFEKFDYQVEELDAYVKDGGLLVIHFTPYSLLDSRVGKKYSIIGESGYEGLGFGKDSKLVAEKRFRKSIFRKQA